jgi:hypothetical protein
MDPYVYSCDFMCMYILGYFRALGDIKNKHALANGGEVKSQKLRILEIGVCVYVCVII